MPFALDTTKAVMTPLSRRDFLLQSSASLLLLTSDSRAKAGNILPSSTSSDFDSEAWQRFGRLRLRQEDDSFILQDGFLASRQAWRNVDFSFAARAAGHVEPV